MTSRERGGRGGLPNSRCFEIGEEWGGVCATLDVLCKFFLQLVMLEIFSYVVNAFYDETGVVLLHGFENSFTVNKQKALTRCVYLE